MAKSKGLPALPRTVTAASSESGHARQSVENQYATMADVAAYTVRIRQKLGLSQAAFARMLKLSAATVRNWEQGRRFPEGPALTLLQVIDHAPDAVMRALEGTINASRVHTENGNMIDGKLPTVDDVKS